MAGVNLQALAQDSLTTLLSEFPLINTFTTNFGGEIATRGESVTTRIAARITTITDIAASGYATTAVVSTKKEVILDKFKGFVMGFDDGEIAKGGYDLLRRTFMVPAAHAVVKAVMDDVFALVTTGNFNSGYSGTIAAFDADSVADVSQQLTDLFNPASDRTLIIKPALYTSLAKDTAIQAQYASGTNAPVTENLLPRIYGFTVRQYAELPATFANLRGIAVRPEALLIATRLPALPTNWYGNVATATDAASGLSIQVREWYDGNSGQQKLSMAILYGVAVGNPDSLLTIVATA